jgi:MFS family permease
MTRRPGRIDVVTGRLVTAPFVLAWVSTFGVLLAIGMLIPVVPVFASGPLGAGTVGVGVAVAATSVTAMLFQPVAGLIADRRGRRPLVIAGAAIFAASVLAYTLVDAPSALVGLRLLGGVGEALVFVATATVINDVAPPDRRGEAVSLYSLAVWGGLAAGPVLGELALGDDSFDTVWVAAAVPATMAALVGIALTETRPAHAATRRRRPPLVHRAALGPGLVLVMTMIGFAGMTAFAPLYARELGLDGAAPVFALNAVIVVSVRSVGRKIPDRFGPRRTATAAVILASAGLATIALIHDPAGLYAGTAVLAFGQALVFPALMTIVVATAPEQGRSSAVGSFTACADLGYAIGAVSLGVVAAAAGYRGVFAVAAVAVACALLPLLRLPGRSSGLAPAVADAPP